MEVSTPNVHTWRCVAVGSTSDIKLEAVREAFSTWLPSEARIIAVNASSGVSPQPLGRPMTVEGATNRCMRAAEACPEADAAIGIENGMWPAEDVGVPTTTATGEVVFEDAAAIVLWERQSRATAVLWTAALRLPPVAERPFAPGPHGEYSVLKDPHVVLSGKPRKEFLVDAMRKWLVTNNAT